MSSSPTDTEMDRQLRRCFAEVPPPAVSSRFDQRLCKRLHPPTRLSRNDRLVLGLYALAALTICVWLMRCQTIGWPILVLSVILPLAITYTVNCTRLETLIKLFTWRD
jgi:hypothetical protein